MLFIKFKMKFIYFFIYGVFSVSIGLASFNFPDLLPFDPEGQSEFAQKNNITSLPATAFFQHENKELLYLAVEHSQDVTSSTFQIIREMLMSLQHHGLTCLILEGFDNTPETIQLKKLACTENFYGSEPEYAAHLAQKFGLIFMGGDPEDTHILEEIRNKYTRKDIAYFYFSRIFSQCYRQVQDCTAETIRYHFNNFYQTKKDTFRDELSYDEYMEWLKDAYQKIPSVEEICNNDFTAPLLNKTKLHQISFEINLIRDREILRRISDALQKYQKTIVIYGASHYYSQHKELIKMFGPPVYEVFKAKV